MTPATMRGPAAALAAATPAGRDRYVDLLRVVSLGVVIAGHWLMAVPVTDAGGTARVTNVLALVPALAPATWLLQVMPVFFLVGGFAHATALTSIARRGGGYADFARSRTARLLRPTAVFVAIWLALALGAALAGQDHGLVRVALRTVVQPLWFLGVYLGLVALAPAMWRLHRRFGAAVPAALLAAAVVVDVLRFHGHPRVAMLNLLIVWAGVHQLGFLYADGTLQRGGRRLGLLLAGGGLTAVVLLTSAGPYPVSMVGVPGEAISNMSPPTAALAAHAVWLVGLVLLLREPATRLLRRARVWRAVVAANGLAMTAFLWHLSAAFVVLVTLGGLSAGAPGSAGWWATRPLWIGAAALVTAVLVLTFRRFDAARPTVITAGPGPRAAAGAALCTLGVLGVSAVGFGGLLEGRTATLLVVPVTAPVAVALVALGAGLLRAAPLSSPRRPEAAANGEIVGGRR
ncbi:acyltransferase [Actinoplanes sp. NPDC049118]|uniref:acyltransferase family protein n=1 Tax=Actinoplanes sp. NPDC049118 TaxID=3155769 RepID=UPI0033EC46A0